MAQSSWPTPADNRAVTDVQHEALAARFSDDGIYGSPADTAVVTAGVGLSVAIRADVHASLRGHGWTSGSTGETLPVAANVAGASRIDWVVLRLDRTDWTVRARIRQGTAGAGAPPLVQNTGATGIYEVPVARATIQPGASSVTVTRAEQYVGARTRPCTSTTRNPHPIVGETCFETNTGIMRLWTGSIWQSVFDDSGQIIVGSPLSPWNSNAEHVLQRRNGSVHLRLGSWTREGGTLAANTESRLPVLIPSAYRHPDRDQYGVAYVTGARIARFIIYAASTDRPGQVWLTNKPTVARGESVLPVSGISWVV
ncbi:hypothetical protein ACFYQA_17260 [Streptomyces sp. NPDC005774]|uniref:hypothetical protein n=1 Tax=Streptomyces sp. NPDC005774 TaxID=3364728 RepID=UPI0036C6D616